MSETNGNTHTSVSMHGGRCSPQSGDGGGCGGRGLPGAPALTHGDVWEAVAANRDEAEKTYGEDGVRVLRVAPPGAPRFDSSGLSHGDSARVTSGDGRDSHGCYGFVGERAPQPAGDTDGITDGVSYGMSDGRVESDTAAVVPAPTIGALAGDTDPHSGGRCDSGDAGTDENIRWRAGGGDDCCGGGDGNAVINTESSPQHPTQCIPDAEVLLFDVPLVLERRYIATPPNGDKKTLGFSSASAATSVSAGEDEGMPVGDFHRDVANSNTCGDSCGDTTGGAAPSSDGDNECCEHHREAW